MADNKITHIGKYDVVKTIGRGGMGLVYKATDPLLGRTVAIKMMTGGFADDPDLLKRFYREAKSTASLRHPNIVTVYDVGDQAGEPYLVMEFLDGESLDSIINSQRDLSLLEKINYIVQVCRGLQYAHDRNIIHRDIKPANIMVLHEGAVKIVDFGIARMGDDRVTRPGQVMGSIHYMSPEQIRESDIDTRTDLFATGTVLYQLLTYNLPFKGEDVRATLIKIMHDPPLPLSRYINSYPPDLDAIIERALAKDSGERYQTADELAFDLTQIQLQLKAGLVAELLVKADSSIAQGGLTSAREHLLELLKLDPENQTANQRMRSLQKSILERRRAEQVQQLRKQAEEAAKQEQFDEALRFVEHAIALDQTNPELLEVRDQLNRAKTRADFIRECMSLAQSARGGNDLDRALSHLDQLLSREPGHAPAVSLRDEISGEIVRREKRRQVQTLMETAHRQIGARQFVEVLEVLDRVKELDPNVPNLRGLVQLAKEGIEHERREQLQVLTFEIERLLYCDNYLAALAQIENGLLSFPDEPSLLRLRSIAERHRELSENRTWVNARIAAARNLLNSGKPREAIAALRSASDFVDRVPPDLRARYDDMIAAMNQLQREANTVPTRTRNAGLEVTGASLSCASDATTREMGSAPSSPASRTTPSNDNTLLEMTPPEGQVVPDHLRRELIGNEPTLAPPAQTTSEPTNRSAAYIPTETTYRGSATAFSNISGWQVETLVKVEKELAFFLGPLARVLVKKAAARTNSSEELYAVLAANLERESDRRNFLSGKAVAKQNRTPNSPAVEPSPPSVTGLVSPPPKSQLRQADVDRAAHLLARHLGPISGVLVKRAAQRADNLRTLYKLLAEHLENSADRARFLRDSGFSDL